MEENKSSIMVSEKARTIINKIRSLKISPSKREMLKHDLVDQLGFLTPQGAMVYLDYLFDKDKVGQKAIADKIKKMSKE